MKMNFKQQLVKVLLILLLLGEYFNPINCQTVTVTSYLTDSLDGIIVYFSTPIIMMTESPYSPSDENCRELSNYFTNCYINFSSGFEFIMWFRPSVVMSDPFMTFNLANPSNFFLVNQPFQIFQLSQIQAQLPKNMLPPQVTLSYPSPHADICSQTIVKIIEQKVNANNELTILSWNLESVSPVNSNHASDIQGYLNAFVMMTHITFQPMQLYPNYSYKFSVTFRNILNMQNKQYFEFSTLTQNTPSVTLITPLILYNIDFRVDFPIQLQYNGATCGNAKLQYPVSQISMDLFEGNNFQTTTTQPTNSVAQIINFNVMKDYFKSGTSYTVVFKVPSMPQSFTLTLNFSTMNALITSTLSDPSNVIIDNSFSLMLTAFFTSIDSISKDPIMNFNWNCVDMSTMSNSCSSLFQPQQYNTLNGNLLPGRDRLYIITVRVQNLAISGTPESFSTIKVIKADINYTLYPFSIPLSPNKGFLDNLTDFQTLYSDTGMEIAQNAYNPDTLAIFMTNFKVQKVVFPQGSQFSISLNEAIQYETNDYSQPFIFSMIFKNRQMNSFYLKLSELQKPPLFKLSVTVSKIYAIMSKGLFEIYCNPCPSYFDVYLYSDKSKFDLDMSKNQFTYGHHFPIVPPQQFPSSNQMSFSLTLPNNGNKNNYNQIFIAVGGQGFQTQTTTFTILDSQPAVRGSTIFSYFQQLVLQPFQSSGFLNNQDYLAYLNYVFLETFNYYDQLECSSMCSIHGTCKEIDELPFKQKKVTACVCDSGYYFPDCSADYSNLQLIFKNSLEIQVASVQSPLQYLKMIEGDLVNYHNFPTILIPSLSSYKSQSLILKNDYIQLYNNKIDYSAVLESAANYYDELIAYMNLAKQNLSQLFSSTTQLFQTKFKQMGMPATYLNKTSYCGIVQRVPKPFDYMSSIFSTKEVIINSVCSTNTLSVQDIPINYDENLPFSSLDNTINDFYLLFLENAVSQIHPNQTTPAILATGMMSQAPPKYMFTPFFDVNLFYQKNGMESAAVNDNNLSCYDLLSGSRCLQPEFIIQNGKHLIKCNCPPNGDYTFIGLAYDNFYDNNRTKEDISHAQIIVILCYIGLFSLLFFVLSLLGYLEDKKQAKEDQENSKNTNISKSENQINKDNNNSAKLSYVKLHSVGNIYKTYSHSISRFARYVTAFYMYLSLPQFSGIIAKYDNEDSKGVEVLVVCLISLPLAIRLIAIVLNQVIFNFNQCLKDKQSKNLIVNLILAVYIIGLYGSLIYLYTMLFTDSNSNYVNNWLIYLAILFGIHALVYEAFAMVFSAFLFRREQKDIRDQQKIEEQKQLEKPPSENAIIQENNGQAPNGNEAHNYSFQNPIVEEQQQEPLEQQQNEEPHQESSSPQFESKKQSESNQLPQPQQIEEKKQEIQIEKEPPSEQQEFKGQQVHVLELLNKLRQEKQQQEEQQQKLKKEKETQQNQSKFERNVQQQIQLLNKSINLDAVSIDGFDENGNINIPSEYDIFKNLPKKEDHNIN